MSQKFIIIVGLFILAIVSGMLGLGVSFAAVPFLGARITSLYIPGWRLKQLFGILIFVTTLNKIYTLLR